MVSGIDLINDFNKPSNINQERVTVYDAQEAKVYDYTTEYFKLKIHYLNI